VVKYRNLHIPDGLFEEIKKEIQENLSLGYRNPSEFIIDATRRRLEEVKKQRINE
jgi:metal-responsive CopG/Arc/MetJ family transcriptional regulator